MTQWGSIHALEGGRVMAEYGPMRLIISARVGKLPQRNMCVRAAREAFRYFAQIAALKDLLRGRAKELPPELGDPLASAMVQSVTAVGDEDLTPMAAVAGTLADAVADFLSGRGMTRVVVDNGGDVAVRLRGDESVAVGIRPDVRDPGISHILNLNSIIPAWGVATSGLGGRSLTRGVASAATAVGLRASMADAAATAIANASYVEGVQVEQCPAQEMDPGTDIPGVPVTVRVGSLTDRELDTALSRALERAQDLVRREIILGAVVAVQGQIAATDSLKRMLFEFHEFKGSCRVS